jgi:hypothetical protein
VYRSLHASTCTTHQSRCNGEIDRVGDWEANADRRHELGLSLRRDNRASTREIQLMLARIFEYQDLGDEDSNITTWTSRIIIHRESPRRLPIVAEHSPVHLHSPTLTSLPLVLDESQVLSGSLSLCFGQTDEIAIVQLSHRSRRKLSF